MKKLLEKITKVLKFSALALLTIILTFAIFVGYLVVARNTPLQLPDPSGSYAVGRTVFNWTDTSRPDPLADRGNSPRKLVVWVWYPGADTRTTPAPYLPPDWVKVRDKGQGAGTLIENNFNRFVTHSFEDIPLAANPTLIPVLIMEPGMGPIATDYTVFAENLASHGYIVVGINPTDTANYTVFLDGSVAPRSVKGTIPDSDTPAAAAADANRIEAVWVQDVTFVMNQLAKINAEPASFFNNRLDLEHIGIWGHSFGGATAVAFCQQDPRCKAGVNMDGTPTSGELKATVPQPFMFITEDYSKGCDQNCELMHQVYLNTKPGAAYTLSIAGTRHFNFSDLPIRQVPVARALFIRAGYEGSINPTRALQIANAYMAAFFDQYLKGIEGDLLKGPSSAFPEVTFGKN